MSQASAFGSLKQLLVGKPIPSHLAHHERLSKTTGLAVLSSDPLSSVAYATEEMVRTLFLAGAAALALSIPIGAVIATLLLLRWIATVAGRSTRDSSAKVIPFRPLRMPGPRV